MISYTDNIDEIIPTGISPVGWSGFSFFHDRRLFSYFVVVFGDSVVPEMVMRASEFAVKLHPSKWQDAAISFVNACTWCADGI